MFRSAVSLSKVTHQMWRNHPFSQRNKVTKRAAWVVGGVEGFGQNLKIGGVCKIREGFHQIEEY